MAILKTKPADLKAVLNELLFFCLCWRTLAPVAGFKGTEGEDPVRAKQRGCGGKASVDLKACRGGEKPFSQTGNRLYLSAPACFTSLCLDEDSAQAQALERC